MPQVIFFCVLYQKMLKIRHALLSKFTCFLTLQSMFSVFECWVKHCLSIVCVQFRGIEYSKKEVVQSFDYNQEEKPQH